MRYLEGEQHPFKFKADRDKLVGHKIQYLGKSDIDQSGRGYYFPKIGYVVNSKGLSVELDNGTYLSRGEIAEIVRLDKFEQDLEGRPL